MPNHIWSYQDAGPFNTDPIGPIPESELVQLIFDGTITRKTFVVSPSRTNNQWIEAGSSPLLNKAFETKKRRDAEAKIQEAESRRKNVEAMRVEAEALKAAKPKRSSNRGSQIPVWEIVFGLVGGLVFVVGALFAASAYGMDTTVGKTYNIGLQQRQIVDLIVGLSLSAFGFGVVGVSCLVANLKPKR